MGSTESFDVLVLGGGFAGLAAATALAEAGARVAVLERKPRTGGRANSFFDPRAGEIVDNGQHLFMGCYRHTREFLRRVGSQDLLDLPRHISVNYADSDGMRSTLLCPAWLKSPYHILVGLLGLKGISLRDKWPLRRLGAWFREHALDSGLADELDQVTVAQWLTSLGQPEPLQQRFYFPIALGALNEDPRRASALGFVQVLKEAFFSEADASRLGLSKVGLSQLYTEQSKEFIARHGGRILTGERVVAVRAEGAELVAATERGDAFRCRALISTLPPWDLARLDLPREVERGWEGLKPSPIVGVNLWLDRPVLSEPFVGLLGTDIQWVFNRSRIGTHAPSAGAGQSLALVISGAHREVGMSPQRIFDLARTDLERCFPSSKKAKITRWTVVKEPFATLSPGPGSDALRPAHRTKTPGFYLAGDWTQTGLPATIESAVKSAHAAAKLALGERLSDFVRT